MLRRVPAAPKPPWRCGAESRAAAAFARPAKLEQRWALAAARASFNSKPGAFSAFDVFAAPGQDPWAMEGHLELFVQTL